MERKFINHSKKLDNLKRILANFVEEKQAILLKDPNYFRNILKKKSNLVEILRSFDNEVTEEEILGLINDLYKEK